ncbi:MAG: riboflavin synthase [Gammaproteobacteria bacterium]
MFTGIVATVGTIAAIRPVGEAMRLRIDAGGLDLSDVQLGDSIAVSGPCLTVVSFDDTGFEVDVSSETLARTTLGALGVGSRVNLEKALRLDERLGGHLVSGHVDGLGELRSRTALDEYVRLVVAVPPELARYLAFKGSVCLNGVSLTVNAADDDSFEVLTIPHTLERTTLGELAVGEAVNIEVDLIARYIERLLSAPGAGAGEGISLAALTRAGFNEGGR